MTFLTTQYKLVHNLSMQDIERLRGLTTHYGVRKISVEGDILVFEYDASRMNEAEALGCVRRAGIDVRPEKEVPFGAVDHTGEFKDFAWPTTGISPANQSQK
jgi:hypothetical protein